MTGWVMLGLEAAGRQPARRQALRTRDAGRLPARQRRPDQLDRRPRAHDPRARGAGLDSRSFAGENLVAELRDKPTATARRGQVNLTAFGVLALRRRGRRTGELGRPARWLREAQNDDGGWGIQPRAPSEADSTGAALQALAAAGQLGKALRAGRRATCASSQTPAAAGRWPAAGSSTRSRPPGRSRGSSPRAPAAGRSPRRIALSRRGRRPPTATTATPRATDQTPVWVTAQALLALPRGRLPARGGAAGARAHSAAGARAAGRRHPGEPAGARR